MWILQSTDPDVPLTFRLLPGDVRTIGRAAGAQFVVDAPLVSRVHCRLTLAADGLSVEDLGSTNGTFVNGKPVAGQAPLAAGDMLRVGRVEFSVDRAH
jgi:pSer/pThr/pTyr-binding forkhead associated (FHA) protein